VKDSTSDALFSTVMGSMFLIALVVILTSCSIPMNRESTLGQKQTDAAKTTTDVVNEAAIQPADLEITVGEKGQTQIQVKQPVAQQQKREADTTAQEAFAGEGQWTDSLSIPLGASLILLGIGLLMLLLVFSILRRSSKALSAAWSWTDSAVSSKIETLRTMATADTNPDKVAAYKTIEAELQHLLSQVRKD
jgi:hypothetical protein